MSLLVPGSTGEGKKKTLLLSLGYMGGRGFFPHFSTLFCFLPLWTASTAWWMHTSLQLMLGRWAVIVWPTPRTTIQQQPGAVGPLPTWYLHSQNHNRGGHMHKVVAHRENTPNSHSSQRLVLQDSYIQTSTHNRKNNHPPNPKYLADQRCFQSYLQS